VFLDRTPFYAESGGQVGDVGTIEGDGLLLDVVDATFALPDLRRHLCVARAGRPEEGASVSARIDVARRQATRRNHTGTHILHWALRRVLGDHVKQAGSLVGPDRLRFDFSHYGALSKDEIAAIESLANEEVLRNEDVEIWETSKEDALSAGAIAFFGDKYGDRVRVLRAGASVELCGGTHVSATGDIGTIKIVAESSIGSNLRRIEATTGTRTLESMRGTEEALDEIGRLVGANGPDVVAAVARRLEDLEALQQEVRLMRTEASGRRAADLAEAAVGGVLVARVDEDPGTLRDLAVAVRQRPGVKAVVLGGRTPAGGVAFVSAVQPGLSVSAGAIIADAARLTGGGGGGKGDLATAGGKNPELVDEALEIARAKAGELIP
jgi:alanyl-tRNA synthetase